MFDSFLRLSRRTEKIAKFDGCFPVPQRHRQFKRFLTRRKVRKAEVGDTQKRKLFSGEITPAVKSC